MPLVTITHYTTSVRSKQAGRPHTESWGSWAARLQASATDHREKGRGGYWVAARCAGPHSDANCAPTNVVALDWDDPGPALGDAEAWLPLNGVAYVAHTTDSHTDEEPRWRVWLLLDREYSADEIRRARLPASWVGMKLRSISQPVFVPTMGEDVWWVDESHRAPHTLSLAPAEAPAPATPPPQPRAGRQSPSPRAINALVTRWLSNPDGTNRLAGATGACLAEWGWSDAEVEAFLGAWLHADPKLAKHTDDALRGAAKRRAGDRIVGFPTLVAELSGEWAAESTDAVDISAVLLEAAGADASAGAEPAARLGSADPPFHWISAREMAEYELPPVNWLCQALALAPGAPALCTGYSGTGKTTTLQDLALSVATPGRRFLNTFDVRHGRVAHIDLEQGTNQTVATYKALGLSPDATLQCSVLPQWLLTDHDSQVALAKAAAGSALVIIDSFRVACLGLDENSSEFAEPLKFLGQLSELTGCVFMLNHHSGKNNADRMKSARGTSAITAACSVHWSFEREDLAPTTRPCLQLVKSRQHTTEATVWETFVEKQTTGGAVGEFGLWARANAGEEKVDAGLCDSIRVGLESGTIEVNGVTELAKVLQRRQADVSAAARSLGLVRRGGILRMPQ